MLRDRYLDSWLKCTIHIFTALLFAELRNEAVLALLIVASSPPDLVQANRIQLKLLISLRSSSFTPTSGVMPSGEAGTDVFDRVSDFWSSLLRSMALQLNVS